MSRNSPAPRGSRRHITRLPVSDGQPFDGWHFTSFVVPNYGPNSAVRWWKFVPLARSLSPPDPDAPFGSLSRQQVLRELRVILCQTRGTGAWKMMKSGAFAQLLTSLSTGLFARCLITNHLVACYPQRFARREPAVITNTHADLARSPYGNDPSSRSQLRSDLLLALAFGHDPCDLTQRSNRTQ